jgi:hypothetical protein
MVKSSSYTNKKLYSIILKNHKILLKLKNKITNKKTQQKSNIE